MPHTAVRWQFVGFIVCLAPLLPSLSRAQEKLPKVDATSPVEAINRALVKPVKFAFVDTPLTGVVEFIQDQFKVRVLLDRKSLEDAGVAVDTPVTIQVQDVTLKSGLNLILRPFKLAWIIRDETLIITSADEAEAHLVVRVYQVRDLVPLSVGTDATSSDETEEVIDNAKSRNKHRKRSKAMSADEDVIGGLQLSHRRTIEGYEDVIEVITAMIEPSSWNQVGGPGDIVVLPYARALVILQTHRVHDEIDQLLIDLRKICETK